MEESRISGQLRLTIYFQSFNLFFNRIFKYSLRFPFAQYLQSSLANSPVVVEIQYDSAYPLPRKALPSNRLKRRSKRGLKQEKRGASNPL